MQTQAVLFTANNRASLQPVTIPDPGAGEVIVQAEYTCISPGTEGRLQAGTLAEAAPYPYIAGYSLTGTIIAVGADCRFQVGQRVWCTGTSKADVNITYGGHIAHALAPESDLIPLPDNVSTLEASIGRLAAIAFHGSRLSRPQPHEKVAVVGLGPIGMLSALCHAVSGAEVIVTDRLPERVAFAESLGLHGFVAGDSLVEGFRRFLPDGADILVDATGLPDVAGSFIPAGKDLAWDDAPNPVGARFLVQGGTDFDYVFPHPPAFDREMTFIMPRDRQPRDVTAVFDLMSRGKLPAAKLISDVRKPESAQQAYADLREKRNQFHTLAFKWS
ncbi:MAG: alcohol dehydrogenase catalytic domain-containing protein [Chloroflexota bacterium]